MRLSDLEGKMVRRQNGEKLGMVFEVHAANGRVVALTCGRRGFWQRLGPSRKGHRIRWERVRHIGSKEIQID